MGRASVLVHGEPGSGLSTVNRLAAIGDAILAGLDPAGTMAATCTRYDEVPDSQPRKRPPTDDGDTVGRA
jgi:hypothetical protein